MKLQEFPFPFFQVLRAGSIQQTSPNTKTYTVAQEAGVSDFLNTDNSGWTTTNPNQGPLTAPVQKIGNPVLPVQLQMAVLRVAILLSL